MAEEKEFESYFQEYIDDGFRGVSADRPGDPEHRKYPVPRRVAVGSPDLAGQPDLFRIPRPGDRGADHRQHQRRRLPDVVPGGDRAERRGPDRAGPGGPGQDPACSTRWACGSLDLKECLLAQMDNLQIKDESARRIITEHLPLLERSDFTQIAQLLGMPLSEVRYHIEIIKRLDPAPGRKYSEDRTNYVLPDIVVSKDSGGDQGDPQRRGPSPAPDQRLLPAAPGPGLPGKSGGLPLPQGQDEKGPLVSPQPRPARPDDLQSRPGRSSSGRRISSKKAWNRSSP